ncbi:hypothetical protein WJX81_005145 [Elliptochloris bilobata]|uniref:Uncharacterized protein n=1 Tax=Elliptochloris bilobata TaxID=381761 RepID=A0AAW1SK38_9CHLO
MPAAAENVTPKYLYCSMRSSRIPPQLHAAPSAAAAAATPNAMTQALQRLPEKGPRHAVVRALEVQEAAEERLSQVGGVIDQVLETEELLPPAFRFSSNDVQAAGLWGMTAAVGAIWLIQPFGYIMDLVSGKKEEAEDAQAAS